MFLVWAAGPMAAQWGACEIYTADSTRFRLTVDGHSFGDTAQTSWRFVADPGTMQVNVFPVDSVIKFLEAQVVVSPGLERSYQLMFVNERTNYIFGIAAEHTWTDAQMNADSTTVRLNALPFAETTSADLNQRFSPAFEQTMTELRAAYLQSEREAIIRAYLSKHPISTTELRQLLSSIDAEDRRLELVEAAAHRLPSPSHIQQLADLFYLTSSQEKLVRLAGE